MSAAAMARVEKKAEVEPQAETHDEEARWKPVMALPCKLTVDLSLCRFTVADFLSLRAGSIVATPWAIARDVPVRINGILVAWGELEAASNRMAVRLTELA